MERFKESRLVFPLHHRMTILDIIDKICFGKHYELDIVILWEFLITCLQTMMIRITERLNQSEGEVKITKRHQTSPHLQNYPAGLPLHYCTSSFFLPTNCQLGPWDLRLSPPNLQQTWNLLDSALLSRRRRHMAKLRITGFLLVFPPSDDNLIKSQMVSGLLPKAIIRQRSVSSLPLEAQTSKDGWFHICSKSKRRQ